MLPLLLRLRLLLLQLVVMVVVVLLVLGGSPHLCLCRARHLLLHETGSSWPTARRRRGDGRETEKAYFLMGLDFIEDRALLVS
jgi:hypothetical protein